MEHKNEAQTSQTSSTVPVEEKSTQIKPEYDQSPENQKESTQVEPTQTQSLDNKDPYLSFTSPIFTVQETKPEEKTETVLSENGTTLPDHAKTTPKLHEMVTKQPENLLDLFEITLKMKRDTLKSNSFSAQEFPILATLKATAPADFEKTAVDIICVIDRSGSMEGEKIRHLKLALQNLIELLDENDSLSIVTFNSRAEKVSPLIKMDSLNKAKTLSLIENISAGGGTDISAGMNIAFDIFNEKPLSNSISGIFLLSDGLDERATQNVQRSLDSYKFNDNFTIHTFGFGSDHDADLMTSIADLRDGNFYFIEQIDIVDQAFLNCLGALATSIAKNVTVTINPLQPSFLKEKIQITEAYGDPVLWKQAEEGYTATILNLISDRPYNYVLNLRIPKSDIELKDEEKLVSVAKVDLQFEDMEGNVHKKCAELKITVLNELEESVPMKDDHDVMSQYYRVQGGMTLKKAREIAKGHKYKEAQKLLRDFEEELRGSCVKDSALVKNLIRDMRKAIEECEPEIYEERGQYTMHSMGRGNAQERYCMHSSNKIYSGAQANYMAKAYSNNVHTYN